MSDTYVELLVKKKASVPITVLKVVLIALTVLCGLAFFMGFGLVALIVGILFAAVAYYVYLNADVEFEYLYVDKELSVDKVMAKSKRKKADNFDLGRLEVLAPLNSHHLDNFKSREVKTTDYSSGVSGQPETRYAMYFDGSRKIILEPSQELIKAIRNIAPRKVFTD